jgi:transaldolase
LKQYEYYTELAKPSRKDILQRTIEVAAGLHDQFPEVTFDELGVEVGVSSLTITFFLSMRLMMRCHDQAVLLAGEMVPAFTGNLHLMVNPSYAYSREKVIEAAKSTPSPISLYPVRIYLTESKQDSIVSSPSSTLPSPAPVS